MARDCVACATKSSCRLLSTTAGQARADALLRRAQISNVAQLDEPLLSCRCHEASGTRQAIDTTKMAADRREAKRRSYRRPRETLPFLALSESATSREYLSKSEGFSAYRLPFREGLA
jgi:hypothetical protein